MIKINGVYKMKKIFKIRTKKNGFSLVELLLVLAIIAALSVAAFIIYVKVSDNMRVAKEIFNITNARASIVSMYKSAPSYEGINSLPEETLRMIFNSTMFKGDMGQPFNTYGGQVAVVPVSIGNNTDAGFMISSPMVPNDDCIKIVSGLKGSFMGIDVNGETLKEKSSDIVSNNAIINACSRDNNNVIGFTDRS